MKKKGFFHIAAAALMLASCSPKSGRELPELLGTVPSDAIVVISGRLSNGIRTMLDSTSALRQIDYGELAKEDMVLSYVYTGRVEPVLTIDTGPAGADTSDAVRSVMSQAEALKLDARFFPEGWREGGNSVLTITHNPVVFSSIHRHIENGTSILDAQGFTDAVRATPPGDAIWLKNTSVDKSIPRSLLEGYVSRSLMIPFLQKMSVWTSFSPQDGGFALVFTRDDAMSHFANFAALLEPGESMLGGTLPDITDFAVGLTITEGFREKYENFIDASVKLDKYRNRLNELKGATGKDPLKWEKERGVREIVRVCWDGHEVLLLRQSKSAKATSVEDNPFPGFAEVLYGNAFAAADESCRAEFGKWLVVGGRADVEAFLSCGSRVPEEEWAHTRYTYMVRTPGITVCKGPKGTEMLVSKTY